MVTMRVAVIVVMILVGRQYIFCCDPLAPTVHMARQYR